MEPISAALLAFGAIKKGISMGKELHTMGKDINNLTNEIVKVSSKGGTTEKAIDVFKQKKIDTIIRQAVKAAHKRSKELSK